LSELKLRLLLIHAWNFQGKRSISDHIEEAVHYIKDLEKNVKELGAKRDQLKNSDGSTTLSGSSSSSLPGNVTIREFDAGLQVEITVGYDDDVFPMSDAIQVILEEGLDVVSCTSSRIGDRYFHHNLICEVMSSFSPFELYITCLYGILFGSFPLFGKALKLQGLKVRGSF